jgi:hypothetical protein
MAVRKTRTKGEPNDVSGGTAYTPEEFAKDQKSKEKFKKTVKAVGTVLMAGINATPLMSKKIRTAVKGKTAEVKKKIETKQATNKADRLYNKTVKLGAKVQKIQKEKPGSQKLQRKTTKANTMLKKSTAAQTKAIRLRSK